MFTLPNGKEGLGGPDYKLADYLKRLNNRCFVKPHLCLPLPPPKLPSELAPLMYGYKFWNNGKYNLIAAGSTGKGWSGRGMENQTMFEGKKTSTLFYSAG